LNLKVAVENVNITTGDNYQPKDYVIRQDPQGGSKKIDEGSTVTIYVSSGKYESDIEVSLPQKYKEDVVSLSLWLNGKNIKTSEKLDIKKVSKYTFNDITSENKNENYVVMIKGENGTSEEYQTISVDFRKVKGNVTVISTVTFDNVLNNSSQVPTTDNQVTN
ncbi:MAG: PASTA domain-containing protein, partial [Ruminococcaceae bacterium]|nr:PASTA domain-containing protein [Oscillospiraceae bacterium]